MTEVHKNNGNFNGNFKVVSDEELLQIIKKYEHQNITIERLAEIVGYSKHYMYKRISNLVKDGYLKRVKTFKVVDTIE